MIRRRVEESIFGESLGVFGAGMKVGVDLGGDGIEKDRF